MSDPRPLVTNADNIRAWSSVSRADLEEFGDEGDFARRYMLTPALLELLGDVRGKRVLDAGAGNGYLSRLLARMGAHVMAVEPADGPFRYIVEREQHEPLGVSYLQQDLSTMEQFVDVFDLAIANVVLVDIPDYVAAIANCLRSLRPNGSFVVSLEHPFTAAADRSAQPFTLTDYFGEQVRPREFGHNFYRTLEAYVDALADGGAVIERIKEPRLSADVAARHPEHAWAHRLPAFIIIKARRPAG